MKNVTTRERAVRPDFLPVALAAVALSVGAGCSATSTPARSPAEEAAKMTAQDRCDAPDVAEAALAPLFEGDAIQSSEPIYTAVSHSGSGAGGNYSQLIGAVVRVSAIRGFTAEWLDRALECHSARRVLGQIPESAIPNDPFWLPGRTVDIEVAVGRDGFHVNVRGKNVADAEEILARANRYVEVHAHR